METKLKKFTDFVIGEFQKQKFTNAEVKKLIENLGNYLYLSEEKASKETLFRVVDNLKDIL